MPDYSREDQDPTETIDLDRLSLDDVSQTGSFVLQSMERTDLGKLLSALPIPVVLITMPDALIRFLNPTAGQFLEDFSLAMGDSLFNLIKLDVKNIQRALNRVFVTRKQQRLEAWLADGEKSKWVRIHLRSLRLSSERLALVLLEDLTHEKEALAQKTTELKKQNHLLKAEVVQRRKIESKLRQAWGGCIKALAKMSEMKDPHTAGHQRRVASIATAIAEKMGMKEQERNFIAIAAEVHDIGKLSAPVELLSKPSGLSEAEFGILKEHPRTGFEILEEARLPRTIAEAVLQHHERINGEGYPQGLKGYNIGLGARIIGVADVVEAMCSQRAYRPARGINEAAKEISRNRGILYDAKVVDACIKVLMGGFRFH
jgi:HD-GYP domain-containing protein (c-di-GMP phosphodiesterase class II)